MTSALTGLGSEFAHQPAAVEEGRSAYVSAPLHRFLIPLLPGSRRQASALGAKL